MMVALACFALYARDGNADAGVWTSYGPEGGRAIALVVDPSNPLTVYATLFGFGVVKSTDGANSWVLANNGLTSLSVRRVVIDPSRTSTLYAATRQGLFKSTDGGERWNSADTGNLGGVNDVAIDPRDSSTVYAATEGPILKSTDGGTSWTAVSSNLFDYEYEIAIGPVPISIIYSVTNLGVFKSTDGGATWTNVQRGLGSLPLALAVDPTNSSTVYVSSDQVYKSTDAGVTWKLANTGLLDLHVYGFTFDPSNPARILAGTPGGLAGRFGRVWQSTNGGASWSAFGIGMSKGVWAVGIGPEPTVYVGTEAGVFKTSNGGLSWQDANRGLRGTDVIALALDPSRPNVVYAGSPSAGIFTSGDSGGSWRSVRRDGTDTSILGLAVDPTVSSTVYAVSFDGLVLRSTDSGQTWRSVGTGLPFTPFHSIAISPSSPPTLLLGTFRGIYKSTDRGDSWIGPGAGVTIPSAVRVLAVDPVNALKAYAESDSDGVLRTRDGGLSWSPINTGLPSASIVALAVDPGSPSTIYAGTTGGVFKSVNEGDTWTRSGLSSNAVTGFAIDPTAPSKLYAGTYGQGVFASADGGVTWTALGQGLTSPVVEALMIDPTGTLLHAGTLAGVFEYRIPEPRLRILPITRRPPTPRVVARP